MLRYCGECPILAQAKLAQAITLPEAPAIIASLCFLRFKEKEKCTQERQYDNTNQTANWFLLPCLWK